MCQCLMSSLKTTLIIFENTAGLFFISFQEVIFLPYLPHLEKYERIPVDYRNVSNNLNQTKRRVKKKKTTCYMQVTFQMSTLVINCSAPNILHKIAKCQ